MKTLAMWYVPEVDVEFTWADVESMILLSERHYDYKCKELSQQYVGVLYGMRNMFESRGKDATIIYRLNGRTADLLAKCVERDPMLLYKMMPIVKKLNDEWRRVNAENLTPHEGTIFHTDTDLRPEQVLPPGSPGSIRRY
jgi:hypothetical protein